VDTDVILSRLVAGGLLSQDEPPQSTRLYRILVLNFSVCHWLCQCLISFHNDRYLYAICYIGIQKKRRHWHSQWHTRVGLLA